VPLVFCFVLRFSVHPNYKLCNIIIILFVEQMNICNNFFIIISIIWEEFLFPKSRKTVNFSKPKNSGFLYSTAHFHFRKTSWKKYSLIRHSPRWSNNCQLVEAPIQWATHTSQIFTSRYFFKFFRSRNNYRYILLDTAEKL
jgi:hypothetical protein